MKTIIPQIQMSVKQLNRMTLLDIRQEKDMEFKDMETTFMTESELKPEKKSFKILYFVFFLSNSFGVHIWSMGGV